MAVTEKTKPASLRARREALHISRAKIAADTGLSGSRIWASEQEGKEVEEAVVSKIDAYLTEKELTSPSTAAAQTVVEIVDLLHRAMHSRSLEGAQRRIHQALELIEPAGDVAAHEVAAVEHDEEE